mmetsp:Transcript_13940/g.40075  ORF Transcript_13940/g.40075 Transcript_13940/m.40075 type:complete len:241 (-) Transcript_13940:183-905(-)
MSFLNKPSAREQDLLARAKVVSMLAKQHQATRKGFENLRLTNNANAAASRALTQAVHEESTKQHEKRKEENKTTHQGIDDLKEQNKDHNSKLQALQQQGQAHAALMEEFKREQAEKAREQAERDAKQTKELKTVVELLSSQKGPNPNQSSGIGASMPAKNLFGGASPFVTDADGKAVGVKSDAEKAKASASSEEAFKAQLARLEMENKDLKQKNRSLTAPPSPYRSVGTQTHDNEPESAK